MPTSLKKLCDRWVQIGLTGLIGGAVGTAPCVAQITPDNTLGTERSVVVPKDVRGLPGLLIEGGALRGNNLFQSFQEFNVGNGQRVYFANPTGVENILGRVTGNNASQILGTLGVAGSANLFLLNPRGILFGPNARLDIAGSFFASTADSFDFENGWQFQANNPNLPGLLTVNLRPGLQRGLPQGNLQNAGNLSVGAGSNLTLYGNTVLNRGNLTAPGGTVQVLGDRIALLSPTRIDVSSPTGGGTVLIGGDIQGKGQVPNARQTVVDQNVAIAADAVTSGNGGKVVVWADEGTRFYGTISAKGGTIQGNGGFVEVSGKQTLDFRGQVDTTATNGIAGTLLLDPTNISVEAGPNVPGQLPSVFFDEDGFVTTGVLFSDNPGGNSVVFNGTINASLTNVVLQADDTITFNAPINIAAAGVTLTAEAGKAVVVKQNIRTNGGNVILRSLPGRVEITDADIITSGQAGSSSSYIAISGGEQVQIENSLLQSRNENDSSFDPSDSNAIAIASLNGSVSISDSEISTSNFGTGDAGLVIVTAKQNLSIQNTGIFSRGNEGGIIIGGFEEFSLPAPENIAIGGGSQINTSNRATPSGTSNAGIIWIQAKGNILINENSFISTDATAKSDSGNPLQGNAGGLLIQAESIKIQDSEVSTSTFTKDSKAGDIVLLANNDIELSDTTLFNNLENGASGKGGTINVAAEDLFLVDGSQLQTLVRGNLEGEPASGSAGEILITVSDELTLSGTNINGNPSVISSEVLKGASGQSGNITIASKLLRLNEAAFISVNNAGVTGSAGELAIASDFIVLERSSYLGAFSSTGQGGNITLISPYLVGLSRNSNIETTSGSAGVQGAGGQIVIRAPGKDPTLLVYGSPARDNNILAEANGGQGGSIDISAFSVRNLAFRIGNDLSTNDISTRSQFGLNGNVAINSVDADPERGTVPLPDRYEDRPIAEGCDPRTRRESSKFVITGPGGLPTNPTEQLVPLTTAGAWVEPTTTGDRPSTATTARKPAPAPTVINEAQGFSVAPNGEILLASQPGKVQPKRVGFLREGCYAPK
ncbi:MAG TPA: filamentous hemagglutinin N-terminal domain-containing protein [Leptolyngbyaceae cyanobacterium M33_DOE_097]|uniref:Filamentous hemagglutinin N-terminal domain-containing protein n=1 Tax=Oscillatoriales cyanobacterium SpSt-418 TaxID=2282169 RepID=A0A7C3KE40_9CYAN|nr:filamentous hemagglutinin N-terminal domain-containing protein [Leptolyngbyaceae cyanobacterium M33_DOE_097]